MPVEVIFATGDWKNAVNAPAVYVYDQPQGTAFILTLATVILAILLVAIIESAGDKHG